MNFVHSRLTMPLLAALLAVGGGVLAAGETAISSPRIETFPREGAGYLLIDWRQRSEDFLRFTLDPVRKGDYLPLMWWDDSKVHWKETTFGLPSYVGMKGQWGVFRNAHEAIVTMGTVISGALLGQDMTGYVVPGNEQPVNLVRMQEAYFSPEDGVFLDGIGSRSGGSFWYELTPNVFAGALVAAYPEEKALTEKWHTACQCWAEATRQMWHLNDFNFQAYDLRAKRAVVQRWREPDSAAALAYLMQMAHAKWPQEQLFYHESRHALDWLCAQEKNLNYEFFPALGVYAAARMNAEQRTTYDVEKVFRWCFEESAVRGIGPHQPDVSKGDGYGVISGRWGAHDVAGLVGVSRGALSTPKMRGGYVFPMETFMYAWALVPAVRYDTRLARAVGKWMHAAAHSMRLLYPDQLPPEQQTDWAWASKHTTAIPYEGLMEKNNLTGSPGPFASGDPTNQGWGPCNIGTYSGALSGVFGAIVRPTEVPGVLALDCRATDFFAAPSFPSTLLYNPRAEKVTLTLPLGEKPVRLWEAVTHTWISEQPRPGSRVSVTIPPDGAVLVVVLPAEGDASFMHERLYIGSTIADHYVPNPKPAESATP
jgi:hypothetical protein